LQKPQVSQLDWKAAANILAKEIDCPHIVGFVALESCPLTFVLSR
jgi:hypothetical protein